MIEPPTNLLWKILPMRLRLRIMKRPAQQSRLIGFCQYNRTARLADSRKKHQPKTVGKIYRFASVSAGTGAGLTVFLE